MILGLLAVLTAVAPPATPSVAPVDNPPIRVSLNSDAYYQPGDLARVRVRTAQDGYVLVLRADVNGRVRVLFPLDPGDDNFVRGGRQYTLPGRGDRQTFVVDDQTGSGTILAAFSVEPFHYTQFVRGDHWDYRVLVSDSLNQDPEAGLLELVNQATGSENFQYDVINYTVATRFAYGPYYGTPCFGCYRPFGFGMSYGFGFYRRGWGLGATAFGAPGYAWLGFCDVYWDPFRCDPWFYDPFFGSYGYGYGYGYGFGYGYGGYGYGCGYFGCTQNYFGPWSYPSTRSTGTLVFKRGPLPPPTVFPRARVPVATAADWGSRPRASQPDPSSRAWGRDRSGGDAPRGSPPISRRSPPPSTRSAPSEGRRAAPPPRQSSPPPRAAPPPKRDHQNQTSFQRWRGPSLTERGFDRPSTFGRRTPSFSTPTFGSWGTRGGSGIQFSVPSVRSGSVSARPAPRSRRP